MKVKTLYTYPIKSLRGCTLPSLTATSTGFAHDRRFMLIHAKDNKNMHVSHYPEMCLFTTELSPSQNPDRIVVRYPKDHVFDHPDEKLNTEDEDHDGPESLEVPLQPEYQNLEQVEVTMHRSPTMGYDMGGKYNEWFSRRFGYEVKLLYLGENRREVLGNVTPKVERSFSTKQDTKTSQPQAQSWLGGLKATASTLINTVTSSTTTTQPQTHQPLDTGISFADCAPFLIINTKSHQNISSRLPKDEPMDISKFRPNIILEGATSAWEEDYWAELDISSPSSSNETTQPEPEEKSARNQDPVRIVLTANCFRCNSLNVDYETGKVGTGESGKVLKKMQADRRVDFGAKWSAVFGRYGFLALPVGGGGEQEREKERQVVISVGDEVEVVRRYEERTRVQWPGLSTD